MADVQLANGHSSDELLPPPLPQPRRLPLGLGFLSPGETPEEQESPPAPEQPAPDGSGSDSAWPTAEHDEMPSPEDTTSTASRAGDSPGLKLGKAAARITGAKAVLMATGAIHHLATKAETIQREEGLYLATQEEAEAIGHPLADIVSRRGGVAGVPMSPDANDALQAAMGLAGYLTRQFAVQMAITQAERAEALGVPRDV